MKILNIVKKFYRILHKNHENYEPGEIPDITVEVIELAVRKTKIHKSPSEDNVSQPVKIGDQRYLQK